MCLATIREAPFRGSPVKIEACDFNSTTASPWQRWTLDGTTMSLRNELTGMCLSSSSSLNGDLPYLVDCLVIAPPGSSNTVDGRLHPTPHTLHPTLNTQHATPNTPHPTHQALSTPSAIHLRLLDPKSDTKLILHGRFRL